MSDHTNEITEEDIPLGESFYDQYSGFYYTTNDEEEDNKQKAPNFRDFFCGK